MTITPSLFAAFLKCPSKCWLRAANETPSGNPYAEWVQSQNESYRASQAERLLAAAPPGESARAPAPEKLKASLWRLAVDVAVQANLPAPSGGASAASTTQPAGPASSGSRGTRPSEGFALETSLHAVERVPAEGRGKAAQFIPIRFTCFNKLTRVDKLLLGFDACVLSAALGREITAGKLIHGDDHATLKVKTAAQTSEVRKRLGKLATLLASPTPPDLVLNRHCAECEFQARCRQKAVETDDLSLLGGMSAMERQKLRSKGIFTVTQLSYTFRPRRAPKRAKNPAKPRYLALQALALRENTVYIHGSPELPKPNCSVFLDIEGLPDRDFYYLIGALVVADGQETFHSFWAEKESDQTTVFAQFVEMVSQFPDFHLFHYGDYDSVAMKRVAARLPDGPRQRINTILKRSVNILSVIHPHIYFPTYSNRLKAIGNYLGRECPTPEPSGLDAVIWRTKWEEKFDSSLKAKIVEYNKADCQTLKVLIEFLLQRTLPTATGEENRIKVKQTDDLKLARPRWQVFAPREYVVDDFKSIVKCAYFDHQREKVFVRNDRHFKTINRRHRKRLRTNLRPNATVDLIAKKCPICHSKRIEFKRRCRRWLSDLKYTKHGVKKWITRKEFSWYYCFKCHAQFNSWDGDPYPIRYGHGVMSWCVYQNIVGGMNMSRIQKGLGDIFGLFIPQAEVQRFKRYVTKLYSSLYAEILRSLLAGPIIHIDETVVNLRKQSGYVWVLASMDRVYYFYRPSREGDFLAEMLASFNGTLISDFFTAYDSLPCRQQKCLAHLIRDIDDDLFHNPLDSELKDLARDFGALLKRIVNTVDKYGLKHWHLHKHMKEANRFLKSVSGKVLSSEVAIKYQKRFEKSGLKMFTFLEHDGVAWNNTNAEHAIKAFAKYRREADGRFTEQSLDPHLILTSILETCAYNNVNVLQFLLSRETTLDGLLRMARRKTRKPAALLVQESA